MLRELAEIQAKPETEDVESVPELCQEEPAVAQAIAAAIRENIPDPFPRLPLNRKRRQDLSYRPSHAVQSVPRKRQCTDEENVVDEPMTPESRILESESPETGDAMIRVDTAGLRPVPKHESKPDIQSTTLAMDKETAAKSNYSIMPINTTMQRTESPSVSEQDPAESVSFLDTVHQIVDIVHLLNKHQTDLPRTVHRRILQSLHTAQKPIMNSTAHQWSDGRMWMEVLERGSATNRRCSVLNMLEYMGASKWYDSQIEHAKRTVYTTENKPVGEKGAATYVLDRITREHSLLSRKAITNQCSRGKRLRELVEKVGLGILISPKIWWNNWSTKAAQIGSVGSTSAVTLSKAVDRLTSQVSTQVFNKRKLDANDTVSINGSAELSIDLFTRLRAGEWLDSWALMAAMHISDRPDYVRFGESIPLDSIGRHGQMRSIKRPFQAWVKRITMFRREAQDTTPLIFYCPVNHNNSHFTLLEVNDSEKAIRHYDSQAPLTARNGTKKTRVAALVEDEFSDLGYTYIEAPTPQQRDGWSCGTRVVWNFRRLANGIEIGSWDTVLSSEDMNMDINKLGDEVKGHFEPKGKSYGEASNVSLYFCTA
uniref:Ubiquitin-like-specific protease 1 n=1 Tax=Talaromyces marneffei PM1 TaxID=1077442 RepID=A0A093ULD9_TALMA